ncbi:MAG: hypothetical protein QE263_08535 [Vampirovibrionales bacterium]|nr:hypothetical protein [Vampirovibrionales bacterium]
MPGPDINVSARLMRIAGLSTIQDTEAKYKQLEKRASQGDLQAEKQLLKDYTQAYTERTYDVTNGSRAKDAAGNEYITGKWINIVCGTHLPDNVHITPECFGEVLAKADKEDLNTVGAVTKVNGLEGAILTHRLREPEVTPVVTQIPQVYSKEKSPAVAPPIVAATKAQVSEAPSVAKAAPSSTASGFPGSIQYHTEKDPYATALEKQYPDLTLYGPVGDRENNAYGTGPSSSDKSLRYTVSGDPNNIQVTQAPSLGTK